MTLWNQTLLPLQWGAVISASLVAATCDLHRGRIPNWLTGPLLLGGLAWAAWVGGPAGAADSVTGCVLMAVPFIILFAFAGGGAGDAKLMGAIGAWVGTIGGTIALGSVAAAGALLGLALVLAEGRVARFRTNIAGLGAGLTCVVLGRPRTAALLLPDRTSMQTMPYGVAIFLGTLGAAIGVWLWHG